MRLLVWGAAGSLRSPQRSRSSGRAPLAPVNALHLAASPRAGPLPRLPAPSAGAPSRLPPAWPRVRAQKQALHPKVVANRSLTQKDGEPHTVRHLCTPCRCPRRSFHRPHHCAGRDLQHAQQGGRRQPHWCCHGPCDPGDGPGRERGRQGRAGAGRAQGCVDGERARGAEPTTRHTCLGRCAPLCALAEHQHSPFYRDASQVVVTTLMLHQAEVRRQ